MVDATDLDIARWTLSCVRESQLTYRELQRLLIAGLLQEGFVMEGTVSALCDLWTDARLGWSPTCITAMGGRVQVVPGRDCEWRIVHDGTGNGTSRKKGDVV